MEKKGKGDKYKLLYRLGKCRAEKKKKVSTTTFLLIVSLSSLSLVLFCRTFFLSSLLHCCYSSSVPLALLSSLSTSNSFRLVVNRSSQREWEEVRCVRIPMGQCLTDGDFDWKLRRNDTQRSLSLLLLELSAVSRHNRSIRMRVDVCMYENMCGYVYLSFLIKFVDKLNEKDAINLKRSSIICVDERSSIHLDVQ